MLRFSVQDSKGPAQQWPLVNAYLLGPDDVATPGTVRFASGCLECLKRSTQPAALCLQFDAAPAGVLMLQTCLLPDRDEPYLLSLELARHRIKTFLVKSEEWQMFELAAEHPAMRLWEEARRLFTEAINMEDPLKADRTARKSLAAGIQATERLAIAHAEILLHRRFGTRPAAKTTLGARVWPDRDSKPLREVMASNFDIIEIPIRWNQIEAEEGTYRWDRLDRWMQWAQAQEKPVIAGPLLDFSRQALPKWMYVWQHDYDTCRDLAYDYIEKVVQRYSTVVGIWSICAGLNVNDTIELKPAQMIDMTRMANLLVRQSHKRARTMIELVQPFGEHGATQRDSLAPLAFIDQITQEGVRVDCLGVQLLFGQHIAGQATRDLMQISSMLDRFFLLELPVIVTALGAPSEPVDPLGGSWHEPWSPEHQAAWASRVFAMAMSKPFVESVIWAELYDHDNAELPRCGLISSEGRAKPAMTQLVAMRRRLRKPLGAHKTGLPLAGGEDIE